VRLKNIFFIILSYLLFCNLINAINSAGVSQVTDTVTLVEVLPS
jgi:hypothetical protein